MAHLDGHGGCRMQARGVLLGGVAAFALEGAPGRVQGRWARRRGSPPGEACTRTANEAGAWLQVTRAKTLNDFLGTNTRHYVGLQVLA